MISAKCKFVSALVLSGIVAVASAQTPSSINFKVSGSPNYPILNTGTGSLVNYDLANGQIDFAVGSTGAYDNPFFCFDFSDEQSGVKLTARDANGHLVMDSVGLGSGLVYNLVDDVISMSPSSLVQCFFRDSNSRSLALFGRADDGGSGETTNTEEPLFSDSFANYPHLEVSFENLLVADDPVIELVNPDEIISVSPEDVISYDLVISNLGKGHADNVAIQEVFPKSEAFSARLDDAGWDCLPTGNAECPGTFDAEEGVYVGYDQIRFQGLSIPANGQLRFRVYRQVMLGSEGQINLFAGAVDGPGVYAESAAAQATLEIVGEAVAMAFNTQPSSTTAGDFILTETDGAIVVHVVDANSLLVSDFTTDVTINLIDASDNRVGALAESVPVIDGVAEFNTLSSEGFQVGQGYRLEAQPSSLSLSSALSNSFSID